MQSGGVRFCVNIQTLLVIVAILLLLILWKISRIDGRLKDRFPTEKEQDYKWSQVDPMGHWEAHKEPKKK
jgi:hypothetical protein